MFKCQPLNKPPKETPLFERQSKSSSMKPRPQLRFRDQMMSNADPSFEGLSPQAIDWERSQMNISGLCSDAEIEAFQLAVAAEKCLIRRDYPSAMENVHKALAKYPRCVDALRVLCKLFDSLSGIPGGDPDTYMCTLREAISFFRPYYHNTFETLGGRGTEAFQLRPVVRFLNTLASPQIMRDRVDICVHALEEVLRIDHEDHTFARERLLLCYLKLIGRARRRQVCYITRTEAHVRGLIDCHFPECEFPLFDKAESSPGWYNEDLMVLRWAEIILDYHNNGEKWKELVMEENKICPWMFQCQLSILPRPFVETKVSSSDYVQRNAQRIAERLASCLADWPKLIVDMHKVLRGKGNILLEERVLRTAPTTFGELCREGKSAKMTVAGQFLEQGRTALRGCRYGDAMSCFSLARACYSEIMRPGIRWYCNAPFQIVSNRALAAERLSLWTFCRCDTRFTLVMQPDHFRSYERLPIIANAFIAPELADELTRFVEDLQRNKPTTPGEWRKKAAYGIAMISIKAIMLSKMGMLTEEKKQEMIKDGIDDMYEPINTETDLLDNLPWLEEAELDL